MHSNQDVDSKAVNRICPAEPLKPALASISDACKYLGDVSRARFYSDILPLLETVHIGTRHFVVIASMDRLIAALLEGSNALPQTVEGSVAHRPSSTKPARLHEP
jgi:hypothetical protein